MQICGFGGGAPSEISAPIWAIQYVLIYEPGGRIFRIGRAAHFEHMSMHVLNVIHLTHIPISIHMHMFTNSILDVMNVMSVVRECNE